MPIAWKGTLAQYAGRLHRLHDAKREVIIYDCRHERAGPGPNGPQNDASDIKQSAIGF
jgi:hypothetical protein